MTTKELKQLLDVLVKHGVTRYKAEGLELELDPIPSSTPAIDNALNSLPEALNAKPPVFSE